MSISNAWSTGLVCLVLTLAGCGGGGGNAPANNTPAATQNDPTPAVAQSVNGAYRGKLYYLYAGQYLAMDLATGKPRPFLKETTSLLSFDVSQDGKVAVVMEELTGGNGDRNGTHRYLAINTETGEQLGAYPGSPGTPSGMAMKLSPDGDRVATGLFRYEWGRAHVVVEDSQGSLLFDFTEAGYDFAFGWLPDGQMVAADDQGWLTQFDREFKPVRRIRQFAGPKLPGSMQISPDGRRWAFFWNDRIWVMDVDGGNLHQVVTSDLWQSGVGWSPDSRSLVVVEAANDSVVWGNCSVLRLVNADDAMVDVGLSSTDPRAWAVKAATGYQGALEPLCASRPKWR